MIDQELRERSLHAPAKGDPAPREKIIKLGKKITDVAARISRDELSGDGVVVKRGKKNFHRVFMK